MSDTPKGKLIEYLVGIGGKENTTTPWEDLALRFGLKNGNVARHAWKDYRLYNKITKRDEYQKAEAANYTAELEDMIIKYDEDRKNDNATVEYTGGEEIKTEEDLIRVCKIDTKRWDITRMVSNAWGKPGDQRYQVKAWLGPKDAIRTYQEEFTNFLESYASPHRVIEKPIQAKNSRSCLIFNKQDSHLNKYDIYGDNDISDRFDTIEQKTDKILRKASSTAYLDKIIYILGSDQFNSEWTATTTKGTPQQNILPYHVAFQAICQHETKVIDNLLKHTNDLEILYVPGNHDEFVGWHMVSWLKAYYKDQKNFNIDISPNYTKYIRYANTACMFNHGDAMKPEKLAQTFPVDFKQEWSLCSHFLIFTGDRHHEHSKSIGGIDFYQIPALSNSKSWWDTKNGHTSTRAKMTAFLIDESNGLSDIYKEVL